MESLYSSTLQVHESPPAISRGRDVRPDPRPASQRGRGESRYASDDRCFDDAVLASLDKSSYTGAIGVDQDAEGAWRRLKGAVFCRACSRGVKL